MIWLAFVGLLLLRSRWRRAGVAILVGSLILLYLLSTPMIATALLRPLDRYPPLDPGSQRPGEAEAIVILSGGSRRGAREYGRDTVGGSALERLRYGVWLQKRLDLPILVTGRTGELMVQAMEEALGAEARWLENQSDNTHEHAVRCAGLFRRAGIERIYLVTHFWHMPRAVASFEALAGVEIVPAPMGFTESDSGFELKWLLPRSGPLCASATILHEWFGRCYYRLRCGY